MRSSVLPICDPPVAMVSKRVSDRHCRGSCAATPLGRMVVDERRRRPRPARRATGSVQDSPPKRLDLPVAHLLVDPPGAGAGARPGRASTEAILAGADYSSTPK